MPAVEATARSKGSPDDVWALLEDPSAWAEWGPWKSVTVEGGGKHELGAVRVLESGRYRVRERITEWVPAQRTSYELLDGMPVEGYRSTVSVEPAEGGSVVRWRSTYDSAGFFTGLILRLAVRAAARGLAKAAGRSARR